MSARLQNPLGYWSRHHPDAKGCKTISWFLYYEIKKKKKQATESVLGLFQIWGIRLGLLHVTHKK